MATTPPPTTRRRLSLHAWRIALAGAAGLTLIEALTPPRYHPLQLVPWEKGDHVIAFVVLGAAAALAFPRFGLIAIGAILIGFGAAIELLQALPWVDRDPNPVDVGWDALGCVAALAAISLLRRRRADRARRG